MEVTPVIKNWCVIGTNNPYTAPEQSCIRISGELFGSDTRPDGTGVITSPVVRAEGVYVRTRSGSVYKLGEMHQSYRNWLDENGIEFDPKNPIKSK